MKVKIFAFDSWIKLEQEMNTWLTKMKSDNVIQSVVYPQHEKCVAIVHYMSAADYSAIKFNSQLVKPS